jgi:hypothetical protein
MAAAAKRASDSSGGKTTGGPAAGTGGVSGALLMEGGLGVRNSFHFVSFHFGSWPRIRFTCLVCEMK